tara:strand:+ start:242 stop:487 length:246 start_codon:yes stop_codon:yes gene_type:complete
MECCICLEEIKDQCTTTSCNHNFHKKCIKKWFDLDKTSKIDSWGKCPLCRRPSFEDTDFNTTPNPLRLVLGNFIRIFNFKL